MRRQKLSAAPAHRKRTSGEDETSAQVLLHGTRPAVKMMVEAASNETDRETDERGQNAGRNPSR
jgi:hypothetical protein